VSRGPDAGRRSILLAILGFLLGPEFLDSGGHFILPWELLILGRVVGRQVGNVRAEFLKQGAGFVQFVALDIRLAISPGRFVGLKGMLLRLLAVTDGKPQVGEGTVGQPPCVCQLLSLAAWIGELTKVELGEASWVSASSSVSPTACAMVTASRRLSAASAHSPRSRCHSPRRPWRRRMTVRFLPALARCSAWARCSSLKSPCQKRNLA